MRCVALQHKCSPSMGMRTHVCVAACKRDCHWSMVGLWNQRLDPPFPSPSAFRSARNFQRSVCNPAGQLGGLVGFFPFISPKREKRAAVQAWCVYLAMCHARVKTSICFVFFSLKKVFLVFLSVFWYSGSFGSLVPCMVHVAGGGHKAPHSGP